ncbi:MAG: DUF5790 family protein [Halobacteriota archaeon]
MSQATFDDDELFSEAATEVREDVETHLDAARAELPSGDDIWDVDAANVLGVLNALKGALDVGAAADELRQAKKWYAMGDRADAFDDPSDLRERIETTEALLGQVDDAREQVAALTGTVPALKGSLDDAHAGGTGDPASNGSASDDPASDSTASDE